MSSEQISALSTDDLREKYRRERIKRLRADGNAQYKEFTGVYEDFDRDPHVAPGFTRSAVVESVDVVIVGGGFGGMLAAANLTKAGITNYKIIEKGGDFGGTWYWNRYPGVACDVESYVYLPLLEETGYMPTEKYAKGPEIFAYCQLLGRTFGMYSGALFQTEVENMVWDDANSLWTVTTNREDKISTRFVVIAGGVLHKAKLPGIAGIETFQGKHFHTSRWDFEYTGGSSQEPMTKLANKRVGIIGTGATAVQVVPKLAESVEQLFVFQRTPSCVGVRNNQPTDVQWFKSLKPGWQAERMKNFTELVTGMQPEVDLIQDQWTKMMFVDTRKMPESEEEAVELERIDFENMQEIRTRISEIIEDRKTAEFMQPWYGQGCKRPCFHDEYLPAFNRDNVSLIDTDGQGVQEITARGVVVDGVEYLVDCLIYASGFEVTTDYTHRLGFDPKGKDGVALSEAWTEGPSTLQGVFTRGFPNLLMISTVQGGQATNFVHWLSEMGKHVTFIIDRCLKQGIRAIEPTPQAQDEWLGVLYGQVAGIARYNATCTPSYLNGEGGGTMKSGRALAYMGSVLNFARHLENWRADNELSGLVLSPKREA